jgi:hypothetical protein
MLLKLLMLLTVVDGSTAAVTAANDVKAAALKTVNATVVTAVVLLLWTIFVIWSN